jgi:hypothetical protein
VSLLIQIIGSALILAAFAANQIGNTGTSSRSYLTANAIGSLALAVSAVLGSQWGFLALEGVWCVVSVFGLYKTFAEPRSEPRIPSASSMISADSSASNTDTKG